MEKWFFPTLLFILIVGCNQQNEENFDGASTLTVEESVEDDGEFEVINEIRDEDTIQIIIEILNNASWETNVDKDRLPPDYRLNNYDISVSPQGNNLEIINRDNSNFARLSEEDSETLFEIITGMELNLE